MKKEKVPRCSHCHSLENLFVITTYKPTGGKTYYCRKCNTNRLKKYRKTESGKKSTNDAVNKSIKKHYHKQKARVLLHWHIRQGNIVRPKICSKCGNKGQIEGHHLDYTKPLKVKWLCRGCHQQAHHVDKQLLDKPKV